MRWRSAHSELARYSVISVQLLLFSLFKRLSKNMFAIMTIVVIIVAVCNKTTGARRVSATLAEYIRPLQNPGPAINPKTVCILHSSLIIILLTLLFRGIWTTTRKKNTTPVVTFCLSRWTEICHTRYVHRAVLLTVE